MFSKELIKGVLREIKHTPRHAREVIKTAKISLPHIRYQYGQHKLQYLCYFQPVIEQSDKPVILFFHGGSWMAGKPEMFMNRAAIFLSEGYPVIMPTHRKIPFHWYPHIREDLILIFRKVQDLLIRHQLQDRPLVLAGMSSGGNLAALGTFDSSIMAEANFAKDKLVGSLFCAAPLHLGGMPDSIVLRAYASKRTTKAFHYASPIYHLKSNHTKPVMIVHGELDGLVPFSSILSFKQRLQTVTQSDLTFHNINNGSHIDAVKWVGSDTVTRELILDWMQKLPQ